MSGFMAGCQPGVNLSELLFLDAPEKSF